MRIAHVTNYCVPLSTGGAEVHCAELARRQREAGHSVIVVTNHVGKRFDDPNVRNLDVKPNPVLLPLLVPQASIDRALVRTLSEFGPDLVHVHNVHRTLGFGAYRVASRWPNVAMIQDYHLFCLKTDNTRHFGSACNDRSACATCARTFYPDKAKEDYPAQAATIDRLARLAGWMAPVIPPLRNARRERFFNAWIDEVIAPSDAVRETLLLWGVPPEHVTTIGNIIPLRDERPVDGLPGANGVAFGFIGKLTEAKGLRVLLEAARAVRASGRDVRLRVAGDGPHAASLREAAAGIVGVEFLGPLAQDQIGEFYRSIDVVVAPSIWPDPAPLVVLESMARGRALIVSEIGGMPDQVGTTALRVPSNDAPALAEAMKRLIDNPALAGALGTRARARFDGELSPENVLAKTEAIYERALSTHARKHQPASLRATAP